MSKTTLLVLASMMLLCPKSFAQDNKVDSLNRELENLKSRVEATEKEQQENRIWKNRKSYFNIGFGTQKLTHKEEEGLEWKSKWAASLVKGTTYYLHRNPIAGMIKFGIDWTQADLHVAQYKEDFNGKFTPGAGGDGFHPFDPDDEYDKGFGIWQMEAAMHVGPSVTINPVDHLKISAYFRYAPSFSGIVLDDSFNCNYASFFVSGASVSYKAISLGVEARWGSAKYKSFEVEEDDYDEASDFLSKSDNKLKTKGMRFYFGFRF